MEFGLKCLQSHLINDEFTVSVSSLVDQKGSDFFLLWTLKLLDCGLALAIGGLNSDDVNNTHVFVKSCNVKGLRAKDIVWCVGLIVRALQKLDVAKLTSLSIPVVLELDLSAASTCDPRLAPLFEVKLEAKSLRGIAQLADELIKLRVLELILGEVSLETFLKNLSATVEHKLV